MKIAGIILLILQAISLFPVLVTGDGFSGHVFAWYIGRFLFGIVGVILLVIHHKRKGK